MKKLCFWVFLFSGLVAGCGGGSKSTENGGDNAEELPAGIPADSQLLGTWHSEFIAGYYVFTEDLLTYFHLDTVYQCVVDSYEMEITGYGENTLSALLPDEGGERDYSYVLDTDLLYFSIQGDLAFTDTLERVSLDPSVFPQCRDESVSGSVSANLYFVELPEVIEIDHAITPPRQVEYSVDVLFDINGSNAIDDGDVFFSSRHFKNSSDSVPATIALQDIDAGFWIKQSGWSLYLVPADIEVVGDQLIMSINKAEHPALRLISNSTQVSVSVEYANSVGEKIVDYYPASKAFTEGLDTSLLEDLIGDVTDDNSGKFDLYQISISVEN